MLSGKLPPALFGLFMQQLRLKPLRRLPFAFGRLTKRGDAATARWLEPVLTQGAIRRDTVRVLRAILADRDVHERRGGGAARLRPARRSWSGRARTA